MELSHNQLVVFHATCGGLALLAGILAFFFRKGGKSHRLTGQLFGLLMSLSAISAVILSLIKPNPFLLGIGFFTLYMIISGWTWIRRMSFIRRVKIARYVGAIGVIVAGFMTYTAISSEGNPVVLLIFSGILLIMAAADIFKKPDPNKTAALHGGRMGGAFIAAVTAFIVVNNTFLPGLVAWLGPTVLISPIIALTIRNYYGRTKRK